MQEQGIIFRPRSKAGLQGRVVHRKAFSRLNEGVVIQPGVGACLLMCVCVCVHVPVRACVCGLVWKKGVVIQPGVGAYMCVRVSVCVCACVCVCGLVLDTRG